MAIKPQSPSRLRAWEQGLSVLRRSRGSGFSRLPFTPLRAVLILPAGAALHGKEALTISPNREAVFSQPARPPPHRRQGDPAKRRPHPTTAPSSDPGTFHPHVSTRISPLSLCSLISGGFPNTLLLLSSITLFSLPSVLNPASMTTYFPSNSFKTLLFHLRNLL